MDSDSFDEVEESDERDNFSFMDGTVELTTSSLPDLAVEHWYAEWYTDSGDGKLEYSIANIGDVSTTNAQWDINLILSEGTDPRQSYYYYLFYEDAGRLLPPGDVVYRDEGNPAQFNVYESIFLERIPAGTYYMGLWLDDLDEEPEVNEANNVSAGNNQVTIGDGASGAAALASGRVGVGPGKAHAMNGRRIPENILMRRVEIIDEANGTRQLRFLDEQDKKPRALRAVSKPAFSSDAGIVRQTASPHRGRLDAPSFEKVGRAADRALFPTGKVYRAAD